MFSFKPKKVLVVGPNVVLSKLKPNNKRVILVDTPDRIFPSIYEQQPNEIIFDYEFLAGDFEKIIRRIRTNAYYDKIKITCLKYRPSEKVDSLLKILGVNEFIYERELIPSINRKTEGIEVELNTTSVKMAV